MADSYHDGSSRPHSVQTDLGKNNIALGGIAGPLQVTFGTIGVLAIAFAALIGLRDDEAFFWRAYLQNFLFILAISLGAFFFVFIQHLTRAGWSVVVRRPAEILAGNLRWIWILFVVPFGILWLQGKAHLVWPWADLELLKANDPGVYTLVKKKSAFLDPTFFWIRAIVYFAVWAVLAQIYLRGSLKLGDSGDIAITRRLGKLAGPAAILFGLTTTFAAFDWIMSLSPGWFSTMFGVYFFTGCATVGFAALIITIVALQRSGHLIGIVRDDHFQDLGKLLFAFGMVFWAYIGYSQYMLIWYANIPEETGWFLARQIGGWGGLSLFLLFGHFTIPFLGFLSKWPKRMPRVLALGALWMAFIGWIDLYWLVMPSVPPDLLSFKTYNDLLAAHAGDSTQLLNPVNWLLLVGMTSVFISATVSQLRRHALLCVRDPWLPESLRFENM